MSNLTQCIAFHTLTCHGHSQADDVSLAPEQERFVAEPTASGRYRTANDVARTALTLLAMEEHGSATQP